MTTFKVYWTDKVGQARSEEFAEMAVALQCTQTLRNTQHRFVTMVSENTDCVTLLGVDAVVDGKLPGGEDYLWKKRRR